MHVRLAITAADRDRCLALRRAVFIEEQSVPEDLELDDHDDDAIHILVTDGDDDDNVDAPAGPAMGTARMRIVTGDGYGDGETAKAQRVAVARDWRGQGVGRVVMDFLHDQARKRGCRRVRLSSQVSAIPFYERLGYVAEGPVYDDAGIPHRDMALVLREM